MYDPVRLNRVVFEKRLCTGVGIVYSAVGGIRLSGAAEGAVAPRPRRLFWGQSEQSDDFFCFLNKNYRTGDSNYAYIKYCRTQRQIVANEKPILSGYIAVRPFSNRTVSVVCYFPA